MHIVQPTPNKINSKLHSTNQEFILMIELAEYPGVPLQTNPVINSLLSLGFILCDKTKEKNDVGRQ